MHDYIYAGKVPPPLLQLLPPCHLSATILALHALLGAGYLEVNWEQMQYAGLPAVAASYEFTFVDQSEVG